MKNPLLVIFSLIMLSSCSLIKAKNIVVSENLEIQKISRNTYVHRTFLSTESFGNVPCNGLIYINENEAIIFDSPTNNQSSKELIDYVENTLNAKVVGIVVNHFHVDCLGGLKYFHDAGIKSYSSNRTIEFAKRDTLEKPEIPQNGFDSLLILKLGNSEIENRFLGEAHTKDNIVSYIPEERVLFGGCMIKEIGAGKGNIADANISEWSNTVLNVKECYPDLKIVVPGHGQPGNHTLLDYTIGLFKKNE